MMISCVSPSSEHLEETLLTLNYAKKTMNIVNEPKITFNQDGEVILQETEEFRIIKKQNDILIRENRQLKRDIENRKTEIQNEQNQIEDEEDKVSTQKHNTKDSKDQLIEHYENQLIELNKGFLQQKDKNMLLAKQMEVRKD